ncbi:MAG TPA: ABC transporter ATP-binding protein, partial [Aggregatilineales bacterium]|nr:ABC transporter ATP-binding protein [Aggregatilineales bacterium]
HGCAVMSDIAIQATGISKRYQRGKTARIQSAGDVAKFIQLRLQRGRSPEDYFWALDDVSFTLKQGEILGIIGENGAGKSTLLKIFSRIVAPTKGKVVMNGRVGALLEVGTGFHDELTGRENVFLNGAILGLKHREIVRLFDEMVAFSGVGDFIDTPVKHYSSGMRLRLGFAVAAHLNPEILIVDEVLAVGDDEFRRRSMGKMNSLANEGRTVIFVSHAMRTVQQLCTRAIYLSKGHILADGTPNEVIENYLKPQTSQTATDNNLVALSRHADVQSDAPRLAYITALDDIGNPTNMMKLGEPLRFRMGLQTTRPMSDFDVIIRIETSDNITVTTVRSSDYQQWYSISPDAPLTINCTIPKLNLEPGEYDITLLIRNKHRVIYDHLPRVYHLIVSNIPYGTDAPPLATVGVVTAYSDWTIEGDH